jgi:hypothetical protein
MKSLCNIILLAFITCLCGQINAQSCQPVATKGEQSCKPSQTDAKRVTTNHSLAFLSKPTCQAKPTAVAAAAIQPATKVSSCQPAPNCQPQLAKSTLDWGGILTMISRKKDDSVQ